MTIKDVCDAKERYAETTSTMHRIGGDSCKVVPADSVWESAHRHLPKELIGAARAYIEDFFDEKDWRQVIHEPRYPTMSHTGLPLRCGGAPGLSSSREEGELADRPQQRRPSSPRRWPIAGELGPPALALVHRCT